MAVRTATTRKTTRKGANAKRAAAQKKVNSRAKKPAARTRTSGAKSARGGKTTAQGEEQGFHLDPLVLRQWTGWMLLTSSLVGFISVFSSFVSPSGQNLLGPYLGDFLAYGLKALSGRFVVLPALIALFFVGMTLSFGLRLQRPEEDVEDKDSEEENPNVPFSQGRYALLFSLLTVELSLLLSLRIEAGTKLYRDVYENNGGMLGVFLVKTLIEPVFGATRFGPYFLTILALILTVVFGVPGLADRLKVFGKQFTLFLKELPERLQGMKPAPNFAGTAATLTEPEAPPTPFRMKKNGPEPIDFDKLKKNRGKAGKETPMESVQEFREHAAIENDLTIPMNTAVDSLGETLEAQQNLGAGDIADMDTRELRKYRDNMAEINRIRELNEWEDKRGDIAIGGLLAKQNTGEQMIGDNAQAVKKQEATLVQGQTPPDPSEVPTAKMPATETSAPAESNEKTIETAPTLTEPTQVANQTGKAPASETVPLVRAEHREEPAPTEPVSLAKKTEVPPPVVYDEYKIPEVSDIFEDSPEQTIDFSEEELKELSERLESQLANFRVKGKVVGICTGPVITRFEVELAPGVKVAKISGLADDLALALRAKSLRILAPIPGKAAVGIEVPNPKPHIVYCKDILESDEFNPVQENIKIVLGKDIAGEAYAMDLARAPHLLIAGQTGSGKSVCINTLMASILCSKTPDDLRMILVDPKVVELKIYENIPHLIHPVVTDPETAVQALKWACWEMDRRYDVLAKAKVRNLAGFNKKFADGVLEDVLEEDENQKMPFLMIVIDELADLMMVAGKEVEVSIARIAQKARAVGIHLVLATQRPSTNVITGVIKANLPTRIAFKVASHIDARTILDKAGAEKLLGRGDMLFRPIESPDPARVHGAFLSDDEAEALADFCGNQNVNYPQLSSFEFGNEGGDDVFDEDMADRDALFNDAAELVVHSGNGSVSMLQRRLSVGHARAGRIMDQLEYAGIVGKSRGSKSREILMDEEELRSFVSGDIARFK